MLAHKTLRILVTGAAGSGTSTLASALARNLEGTAIEADDFFWLLTDPPYRDKRPADERLVLAREALAGPRPIVMAGSVMCWGGEVEDAFDLIVFLRVPTPVRLERLRARERARFGRVDEAFLKWAGDYDTGTEEGRSLSRHLAWIDARDTRKITLAGHQAVEQWVRLVLAELAPMNCDTPASSTHRG